MKNLLTLILLILLTSCSQQNESYETNLKSMKSFFTEFENANLDAVAQLYSNDTLNYQGAFYGSQIMTSKDELMAYMGAWHEAMSDIKYTADYFLPGVNEKTGLPDGSVRTYGTWSGTNKMSGKSFSAKFYHYANFDDKGLIIAGGDYGDATGLMIATAPDLEVTPDQ